jgi:virginiamycin B lyase
MPLNGNVDEIAAGEGGVWVLDSSAGTVIHLDPRSLDAVGNTIRVGTRPASIATGLGAVWVANQGDGTITRIDADTRQPTTIELERPVVAVVANSVSDTVWAAVANPPND